MYNHYFQTVGYEGYKQTAHVFPLASLTYPDSPQVTPQEFLINQKSPFDPTNNTPWLTDTPHELITPPLY